MNFINETYIDDSTLCDDIINWFHTDDAQRREGTYGGSLRENEEFVKKSTESEFREFAPTNLQERFYKELQTCVDSYIEKYPWCAGYDKFGISEGINVQWYKPNEGYISWHTERATAGEPFNNRHLVFMLYLNNVEDGGTEFYHQKLITKAEKGKMVIWPADWTHTHRGVKSTTKDKYIMTGWFSYFMEK